MAFIQRLVVLSLLLAGVPAFAESGVVNLNVDAAVGAPFAGRYGTVVREEIGAAQAYGGHFSLGADWQLLKPLALEVIGTGGFEVIPRILNRFYGRNPVYSVVPVFSVAAGPRLRLLDKKPGGNLWASAHAGFHYFDGPQFGVDAGLGYQVGVLDTLSVGPFARGAFLLDTSDESRHGVLVTAGLAASFDLIPFEAPKPKAPVDTDGDGVPDDRDGAPTIPEDHDNFEDEDGVPDVDNDNDGLRDADDRCPMEAGPSEHQGCPPPPDRDGDGVIDTADAAPDAPEDKDGFEDADGAPDPDNDKDGVLDVDDACPLEAGVADERGCPMKDQDGDGVADRNDNCQAEAGPKDNQGCPVANKQLVVVTKEKLQILESVFFDTGKATIQKRSNRLLDQVASIIKEKDWIKQVRIEGHTDSVGSAAKNQKLSEARASAVRTYLIKQGVAPERLVAVGFGADKPVSDNVTKEGRAANRRVEFNVVQAD